MSLIRSAATVSGFTTLSRVLGYVRDMLIAGTLGTGPVADAYVIAFRFPNLFRRLFGEGAFNSAFVPLFVKRIEAEGVEGARRFGDEVLAVLFAALVALTVVAEIAMPLLMYAIAPGFAADPGKFDLTVTLTRIAFPYLLFISLVALYSGVLNSLGRFAAAAAAPVLLNVAMIAVLAWLAWAGWGAAPATGAALVWAVSAAGVLQLVMLAVACRRAGMTLRLRRPVLTEGVRRMVRLGIPGVIAGGITQVNLLIGTIISSLQESAPAWLYYADRVYQMPLGMVGVAIGVVLLPDLSRKLRAGDGEGARRTQNRAVELAMLLTLPATIALLAIPGPVVQVLFERGAFAAADTAATAAALAAFALGLPAFVLIKVFSPGYFAHEDTRTPMLFAAIGVGLNVAGSLALFAYLGHVGIALATSVSSWVNAVLLGVTLARRGLYAPDERLQRRLPRIILASLLMGAMLLAGLHLLPGLFAASTGGLVRIAGLAAFVAAGAAAYFALAHLLGAARFGELAGLVRRA